jgi:P-type Cu+ transporter
MKVVYSVAGMSCKNCKAHVEDTLKKVEGITGVSVDLEKGEAEVEMSKHVGLERLQEALEKDGGRYTIHPHGKMPRPG